MGIADDITYRIGANAQRFKSEMGGLPLIAKTAAGAIAAAFSSSKIRQAVSDVAEIGKAAQIAGTEVEAFQKIKFGAEQAGVGLEAVTDGLKEMQLRADEFVRTGAGPAQEAFERLGIDAETLNEKLQKPDDLFVELIDKMSQFEKAAQIRIADEIFGGSAGERFVQILDQGADKLRENIDEAEKLGLVFKKDVVDSAMKMEADYNRIVNQMAATWQRFVVGASNAIGSLFADTQAKAFSAEVQVLETRLQGLNNELNAANREGFLGDVVRSINDLRPAEAIKAEIDAIETELRMISSLQDAASLTGKKEPKRTIVGEADPKREAARNKSAAAASREADQIRRVIEALQFEFDALSMTEEQKRIATELRAAGVDAASREGQAIAELVTMIEAEERAREALRTKAEEDEKHRQSIVETYNDIGQSAIDAAASVIDGSVKGSEALKRFLIQMALAMVQAQAFGNVAGSIGSGGPNLLSSVATALLPRFSKGGISDQPAIFGEAGAEAAVPLPDGRRIPVVMDFKNLPMGQQEMAAQSPAFTYAPVTTIDGRGADQAQLQRLQRTVEEQQKTEFQRFKAYGKVNQLRAI